jgi:alpha-beta hydrolase superfamily lysophospholipase
MAGYNVWTMDYRGFGESTGRLSEAALLADVQMVYKRMRQEEDEARIIVWGRSLGSGMAAYVASGNSPQALVLETPYWSLPDAARHRYPVLPRFLFRYRLPTHEYVANVDCPVYLIHGTQDEKIAFSSSQKLERLCKQLAVEVKMHVIRNGQHDLRSEPAFKDIRDEILEQISRQQASPEASRP